MSAGTGANRVPLGRLHPVLRGGGGGGGGQKSGGSGESMLNAARLAAARVTDKLKPPNTATASRPAEARPKPVIGQQSAVLQSFPGAAGTETPPKRKRRSRWGGEEKAPVPSLIPSGISAEQEKQVLLHLKVEDLSRKLRSGDLGIPPNPEDRSPSPEPIYDHNGKRLNTREYRTRKRLEEERHNAVQEAMSLNTEYKPPADYKPPVQKISDRVTIPQDENPHLNFVGLLIGPRGNTLKKLEKDTGTKIMIRGKGSIKEGKVGRKDGNPLPGEDEPLHALVTASSAEAVKKAVDQIRKTIKEGIEQPEGQNDLRRKQLRELAKLNGTLREEDMLRCSNCGSTDHRTWQCSEQQNVTGNVSCGICGGTGHLTADCRQKASNTTPFSGQSLAPPTAEKAKMDSEYMSFMAELGEGPAQNRKPPSHLPPPPMNSGPPPPLMTPPHVARGPPPQNIRPGPPPQNSRPGPPPQNSRPGPPPQNSRSGPPPLLGNSPARGGPNTTGPMDNGRDDRPVPYGRRDSFKREEQRGGYGGNGGGGGRGPYNGPSGDRRDNYRGSNQQPYDRERERDHDRDGYREPMYGDGPPTRFGGGRPRPLMSQGPYSWRGDRDGRDRDMERERVDERGPPYGGGPHVRPPFGRRGPGGPDGPLPPPHGMSPGGPPAPRGPPPPSGPGGGIPPLMHTPPPNLPPPGQPNTPGQMLNAPLGQPMNPPPPGQPRPGAPLPRFMGGPPPQPAAPSGGAHPPQMNMPPWGNAALPPMSATPQHGMIPGLPHAPSVGQAMIPGSQPPLPPSSAHQPAPPAAPTAVMYQTPASGAQIFPWQQASAALAALQQPGGAGQPAVSSAAKTSSANKQATTTAVSRPSPRSTASSIPSSQPTGAVATTPGAMVPPQMAAQPMMMAMGQWPNMMMHPGMMGMMPGMAPMMMAAPTMAHQMAPGIPGQQPAAPAGFQPPPPPIDSNQMASLINAPPPPPPPP